MRYRWDHKRGMLNSVIGLLVACKAGVQQALGEQRMVDEMPQGEQVMVSGLAGSQSRLCRAAKATFLTQYTRRLLWIVV